MSDDKTKSCIMMAGLLLFLALFVGFFQFYVSVMARVNNVQINHIHE